jgi:hypothetical protein
MKLESQSSLKRVLVSNWENPYEGMSWDRWKVAILFEASPGFQLSKVYIHTIMRAGSQSSLKRVLVSNTEPSTIR